MEKLIFETNIASDSLAQRINHAVKEIPSIKKWEINLDSIYNLLTIEGICLDPQKIISLLSLQGIQASRLYEE